MGGAVQVGEADRGGEADLFGIMDGEPDGVGGGLLDPMFHVAGDEQGIAGLEFEKAFVVELKDGRAPKQEYPFVVVLVIPEVLRTRLAV